MLVWRIKQLISFYLSATTVYQVHAPYLYSILENCVEKRGSDPSIQKIEINKRGKVRRARIFYFRNLTGKKAKIKEKRN